MQSVILKTATRLMVGMILVFAVYLLLRGHHEPGGGFIAALVAGTGFALFAIAEGPGKVHRAVRVRPAAIACLGLGLAIIAGLAVGLDDADAVHGLRYQRDLVELLLREEPDRSRDREEQHRDVEVRRVVCHDHVVAEPLDDEVTPAKHLFVRNNGRPPAMDSIDPQTWRLEIGGESAFQEMSFSIGQLKGMFEHYTYQLQLECGGNGRSEFVPGASGNQWSTGAIGCPEWTGVRLKDVLEHVGMKDDAVYVAYYGADLHASGDPTKAPMTFPTLGNVGPASIPITLAGEQDALLVGAVVLGLRNLRLGRADRRTATRLAVLVFFLPALESADPTLLADGGRMVNG